MPFHADLILKGGTVVNHDGVGQRDIAVSGGRIVAIGSFGRQQAGEVIDCTGLHVLPGVVDSQVHLREPGAEHKEDLETGGRAAVMGGVTGVFEMPNTSPLTTSAEALADKVARALTELERKARKELIAAGTLKASGTEGDGLTTLAPLDPTKVDPQNPPPKGVYFEIKEKERTCHLTDAGVRKAEELAGVESFYTAGNMEWPHLIDNALKAHHLYQLDRHYMIDRDARENNELSIVIIDEHTGRAMYGRQWSDGLHQAVEAKHPKEGVQIKQETQTMATVTLQNFFKLYQKLAGMTGTAKTEEKEFVEIYGLHVVEIPTNVTVARLDENDYIFKTREAKWAAVVDDLVEGRRWFDTEPAQLDAQRIATPVARESRWAVGNGDGADLCAERIGDRVLQILATKDSVTLAVYRRALLVDHVVEFDDALAHVEVVALYARLCTFDGSAHHRGLDRLALVEAESIEDADDAIARKAPHQVVFERKVEARRAWIALSPCAAAQLIVDATRFVALGADDAEPAGG